MGLINNISGVQQSDSVIYINIFLGFPGGSAGKESACSERDLGSIPGLGRSPGERKGYPLQYSGLENSRDCLVQGVAKSQTQLSNFHSINVKKKICVTVILCQYLTRSEISLL